MPHKNTKQSLEDLFEQWLAGEVLSALELSRLTASSEFNQRMETYSALHNSRDQVVDGIEVPKWDRSATFHAGHAVPVNRHTNAFSMLAFSFSMVICVLFFFDMKVQWNASGPQLVSAAEQKQQWQQEQLLILQNQMDDWAAKNNQLLVSTMQRLEDKQSNNTVKLASYLFENSRTERAEDLQRVVSAIQQQRLEDLKFIQGEIGDLQYQFQLATMGSEAELNSGNPSLLTDD